MTRVLVVGAGPAGCHAAAKLAETGYTVELFEEHENIGLPIACTGIVTTALYNHVPRDESYIINELYSAEIHGPTQKTEISLREDVICRHKFDSWMAENALGKGVKIHTQHRFKGIEDGQAKFSHKGEIVKKDYDILVGADGPLSDVSKAAGLWQDREYWIGMQVTLTGKWRNDAFQAHFGRLCPGFFAWVVPESQKLARVGLASQKGAKPLFDKFINSFDGKVVATQAGPIPWHSPKSAASKDNTYLVGDAAGFAKATTGGGIITGIWSADVLAECLSKYKDYERALKPLRRELWIHYKIRDMLNRFEDKDYDRLVGMMSKQKVREILATNPREYPSRFMFSLLRAEPRLVSFARFAW